MSDQRSDGDDDRSEQEPKKGSINDPLTQSGTDAPQQTFGSEEEG